MKTRRIPIPRGNDRARSTMTALPSIQDPMFFRRFGPKGDGKVTDAFKQMPWVFAGIQAVARLVSAIPLRVFKGPRPMLRHSLVDPAAFIRERIRAAAQSKSNEVAENHPLVLLFDRPCPALTRAQHWQATAIHEYRVGECTWIALGKGGQLRKAKEMPTELWPQNSRGWKPLKEDGSDGIDSRTQMPAAWKAGQRTYKPESLVRFTWFDPDNPLRGMSPLDPAKVEIEADMAAGSFNRNFFTNGCNPGGIFKHPRSLTAPQRKDFLDAVNEENGGEDKAFSTLLLENGVDFAFNPRSQKDAEFIELRRGARDVELAVIGVQKAALSITDDLNYATALGQRRVLIENTVLPIIMDWEDAINGQLLGDIEGGAYWVEFDLSAIAALQEDIQPKAATASILFGLGYSRDEVNKRLKLGFDEDPATDVRGGPGAGMDAGLALDAPTPAAAPTTDPKAGLASVVAGGGSAQDAALNGAQTQGLIDIAKSVQAGELAPATAIAIIVAAYPTIDAAEAGTIVNPAATSAADKPNTEPPPMMATPDPTPAGKGSEGAPPRMAELMARASPWDRAIGEAEMLIARTDLDPAAFLRAWKQRVTPPLETLVAEFVRSYFGKLQRAQVAKLTEYAKSLKLETLTAADIEHILFARAEWDQALKDILGPPLKKVMTAAGKRLAKEIKVDVVPVNNPAMLELHARKLGTLVKVNATTRRVVRSQLIEGTAASETIDELRMRLNDTFDEGLGGNDRALRVARTETGMMTQATRNQGMRDAGIDKHKWFSVLGPDTRDDHRNEHGHVVAIGDAFPITGLHHPLEMGAPPEQVVNCDCDALAVLEGI